MAKDDNWAEMYDNHPDIYHLLVECEDYQGNLLPELMAVTSFAEKNVVEFGAGTGRVTGLVAPYVKRIVCCDISQAMLTYGRISFRGERNQNVHHLNADSRMMPLSPGCADIGLQGWSFLQIAVWHPQCWQQHIDLVIEEMIRLLRSGGYAILIETLGTGEQEPRIPENFEKVYVYWEEHWGFQRRWLRTDYLFNSRQQARLLTAPFFGEEMAQRCYEAPAGLLLPECTGIWCLQV